MNSDLLVTLASLYVSVIIVPKVAKSLGRRSEIWVGISCLSFFVILIASIPITSYLAAAFNRTERLASELTNGLEFFGPILCLLVLWICGPVKSSGR